MRLRLFVIAPILFLALCCGRSAGGDERGSDTARTVRVATTATIGERFQPPAGFVRAAVHPTSFGHYLRDLPLAPDGTHVRLYDGSLKHRQDVHAAVVTVSVGTADLQQCADAIMRLRAEHLFAQARLKDIHFKFTNGFNAEFARWANGERIQVRGNECLWKGEGSTQRDHANLMAFLQKVFTYAGTLSLSKELSDVSAFALEPGDVFIQGGSPGHAVIVVDKATDHAGRTAFLLAQSYMPAQDIHVVKNLRHPELGAWYILERDDRLYTPEWTFSWSDRRRWR